MAQYLYHLASTIMGIIFQSYVLFTWEVLQGKLHKVIKAVLQLE